MVANRINPGGVGRTLGNQPGHYTKFLGKELGFLFVGPLLIVMPVCFGIYDGGGSTAAERRVLGGLHAGGRSSDALTSTATAAVTRLLAAGALRSKDVVRPRAAPYPGTARREQLVKLYYTVQDDSDRAAVVLSISAGRQSLATFRLPLRRLHHRPESFALEWRVPKRVPRGGLRFCIVARDAGGNASPRTCAMLSIR